MTMNDPTSWRVCERGCVPHETGVFDGELLEKILIKGHGSSESLWAAPLGDDRYELRNDAVLFDAPYGSVVVASSRDSRGFPVVTVCPEAA